MINIIITSLKRMLKSIPKAFIKKFEQLSIEVENNDDKAIEVAKKIFKYLVNSLIQAFIMFFFVIEREIYEITTTKQYILLFIGCLIISLIVPMSFVVSEPISKFIGFLNTFTKNKEE